MAATATCPPPPPATAALGANETPVDPPPQPSAQLPSLPPVSAPTSQRPPLARRPRSTSTARPGGVRRRVSTGADSDSSGVTANTNTLSRKESLRAFLSCVAEEIHALVVTFHAQPTNDQHFFQFKTLWLARRMSTLFHIEFWDSSPSDVHHAILQVALELLVDAADVATREGEADIHLVRIFGHVFALYCAYRVQVSTPKIKIAVDPSTWLALSQLSQLLTQRLTVGSSIYQRAAREALAMLRRLEYDDDAFLKCLGGSVGEFQLKKARQSKRHLLDAVVMMHAGEALLPDQRDDEKHDMVQRLEALSTQYNAALQMLAQGDHNGDTFLGDGTATNRGTRGLSGRGRAAPSFLRNTRPLNRVDNGFSGVVSGLWGESRISTSSAWVSRLRHSLEPQQPEEDATEKIDSVASIIANSLGDDTASEMDAALLALEEELVREDHGQDISTQQAQDDLEPQQNQVPLQRAVSTSRMSSPQRARPARALSIISSGQEESDGLDELEAELMQDAVTGRSTQPVEPSAPKKPIAAAVTHKKSTTARQSLPTTTQRRLTVEDVVRPTRAMSAASSTYESDGLDELEAELTQEVSAAARPTPPLPRQATRPSDVQKPVRPVAPPARRHQRAPSVVSNGAESDGLSELEAELKLGDQRTATLPQTTPSQGAPMLESRWTRARAASLTSSGHGSDGLEGLIKELEQDVQPNARTRALRSLVQDVPPTQRKAIQSSIPVSRRPIPSMTARVPTRARLSSRSSDVGSMDELMALQRELDAASLPTPSIPRPNLNAPARTRKRPVARPAVPESRPRKRPAPTVVASPPVVRRSRRLSIASSARSESDVELAALEVELSAAPKSTHQLVNSHRPAKPAAFQTTLKRHQQRPRRLSIASATTESDEELKQLEAELAVNAMTAKKATPAATARPTPTPRPKALRKPRETQPRKATKRKEQVKKTTQPKPRKPRQPTVAKVASPALPVAKLVEGHVQASARPLTTRISSSRRSVASSYDSDGLDELDRELQAFQ